MTRRDLIRKITIGGVTFLVMPSLMTDCTKNKEMDQAGALTIDLSSSAYSALKTAGGSVISGKIIIMNISGSFVALSSICTHENCTVEYLPAQSNLQCPCHGSVYATTGSVISGPAPAALRSYTITRSGDILTINL